MTRKERVCQYLLLCAAILPNAICDIIDNSTHKSEAKGEVLEISGEKTTPILSTRSNFISASTVLNPPNPATEPIDWTLENFRRWVNFNYSRKPNGLLSIPDESIQLNSQRGRSAPDIRDEYEDIYPEGPQHNDAGASRAYENEVSSYYIFKNQKTGPQRSLGADNPYIKQNGDIPTDNQQEDENIASGTTVFQGTTQKTIIKSEHGEDVIGRTPEITPLAEPLHSAPNESFQQNNDTTVNYEKVGINKVSKEPVGKDSMLETLTNVQFSWVDIIIAVCCTAAILLILINIGVCVQYCLQKKTRLKRFRPYTLPLSTALRMRMDSLRLRKPNLKNRPWSNCHRPFLGRFNQDAHRIMWPTVDTNSHETHETASTNVSMLSLHSADKGTQYENTDAMIANFVNSDLIVELNDRDSACTSISDGFTFSREYGTPQPLHSSVTDL